MSNLVQRTITGIIFLAIVIGAIMCSPVSFGILFGIIITACLYEFYKLVKHTGIKPHAILGIVTGLGVFGLSYFIAQGIILPKFYSIIIIPFILLFIFELYRKDQKMPYGNIAYSILGIIYIAVPLSLSNFLVFEGDAYNWHTLLGLMILIWTYDTLAYVFGVSFGKHRLFERVSPKKSWEGFIGGALSNIGMAYVLSLLFPTLSLTDWIVASLIASIIGTYGDLSESLFKRNLDIKDSGSILPGHGGFMDRFDSLLFALPVFYVYLLLT